MIYPMLVSRCAPVAMIFQIFVTLAAVPRCSTKDVICASGACIEGHEPPVSLLQTSLGFHQPPQRQQQPSNASAAGSSEFVARAQVSLNHSVVDVVKLGSHEVEGTALRHLHGGDGKLDQTMLESAQLALNHTISESELITGAYAAIQAVSEQRAANHQAEQSRTSTKEVGTGAVMAMIIAVPCLTFLIIGVVVRMNQGGNEREFDPFVQKPMSPQFLQRGVPGTNETLPSSTSPNLPTSKLPRGGRSPTQTGTYPGTSPQPHPGSGGSLQPRLLGDEQMLPPTVGTGIAAVYVPLPPICPSLMLPRTEARFLVSMNELMQLDVGSLEIKGTSGRPLLRATLTLTPQGTRHFAMASMGCEDDPRTIVVGTSTNRFGPLEVYGRGGQLYGMLQPGEVTSVLHYQGQPVMKIDCGSPHELCMSASAMDGSPLGVGRGGPAGGGDHWKLTVKPNQDAVLIASCMLSLILLGKQ